MPPENVTVQRRRCSAAASAASRSPTSRSRRPCCRKAMDGAAGQGGLDARGRHAPRLLPHGLGRAPARPGSTREGKPMAWLHRSVGADDLARSSRPTRSTSARSSSAWALDQHAVRHPEHAHREPARRRRIRASAGSARCSNIPHAFAVQSFVGRAGARGRARSEGLPARADRARRARSTRPSASSDVWNHGEVRRTLPGRHRPPAARDRDSSREKAGWGRKLPTGSGLGIAAHYSFVTYVATVVEAAVDEKGTLTVPRVDIAVDCGPRQPRRVRSQIEGAGVMGHERSRRTSEITFKDGRVAAEQLRRLRGHPHRRRAARDPGAHRAGRHYDVPLGGVGEPGVPPIAPALCNAIFAATGKRIRAAADRRSAGDLTRLADRPPARAEAAAADG